MLVAQKTITLAGFRYNRVPSTTTPRPIPIPGIDFPFHIPPSGPLVEEEEEYDQYDYKEYEHHDNYDRHDVEYDDYSGKSSLLINHSECALQDELQTIRCCTVNDRSSGKNSQTLFVLSSGHVLKTSK